MVMLLFSNRNRDSPAAQAGIQAGDIIRKLQGLPSKLFSLDHIAGVLQRREGKKIRFVVQRKNEILRIQFKLRKLI